MANALLTEIALENFKSHRQETVVKLNPLTVLVGPNNSGKSSIVQALLLLKQTLEFPRVEIPLHLAGVVEANSLREITYGWPVGSTFIGPRFRIKWRSDIDTGSVLAELGESAISVVDERLGGGWFHAALKQDGYPVDTSIDLAFAQMDGELVLHKIILTSFDAFGQVPRIELAFEREGDAGYRFHFNGEVGKSVQTDLDHFIPFISINARNVGPRDRQRAWVNAFKAMFVQPLDDLRSILNRLNYLSSTRSIQPAMYRFSTVAPDGVGVSGELAAQLLQASKDKKVLYLTPSRAASDEFPSEEIDTLQNATRGVLKDMGIDAPLAIEEIGDIGFRLLFGQATLQHVGRGLTYLLPIVEMGLIGDPSIFSSVLGKEQNFKEANFTFCSFEEPEAHLHPRIQSKLAEWFVALAVSKRQVLVETHSDHLVRKLRSLVAERGEGSPMEQFLSEYVSIIEIEQEDGVSKAASSSLHRNGDLDSWPRDFMGQAQEVESAIYLSSLNKASVEVESTEVRHSGEYEPYERPD